MQLYRIYSIVVCDGDDHLFVVIRGTVERFGWITANGDTSAEWRELKGFQVYFCRGDLV
jgi:hypothetical protein